MTEVTAVSAIQPVLRKLECRSQLFSQYVAEVHKMWIEG